MFRLSTCLFWIENRKIKSLAYTCRWVCQGTKIQKYDHNKKYIPYSFFEFFYTFGCIFNLHSEIECLLILLTRAFKFIKNSTTVNYWRHVFNFLSSSTVWCQLFQLQNKHVHFPIIHRIVLCKITIDLFFETFMMSICEKKISAEARLIHAEQISLYNFIVLRKRQQTTVYTKLSTYRCTSLF